MTQARAVDVHGHAVPETVLTLIEQQGHEFGGITLDRADGKILITLPGGNRLRPVPPGMAGGSPREAWMQEQAVSHQLVGPWMDIQGNGFGRDEGVAWASALNDAMAAGMAQLGAGAHLLSTIYPADPAAAADEMVRARDELGAVGVMLATHFPHGSAAEPEFEPFLEAAARARVPLVLHPPIAGPASAIPGDADFRSLYGRTLETSLIATRLIVSGVLERLPDLRIVLVHGGGFLPFQAGRLDQQVASGKIIAQVPNGRPASSYLDRFYYDTAMLDPDVVAFLVRRVPDRVVIGTDYPFTSSTSLVPEQVAAVPEAVRAALAHDTAHQLFALTDGAR